MLFRPLCTAQARRFPVPRVLGIAIERDSLLVCSPVEPKNRKRYVITAASLSPWIIGITRVERYLIETVDGAEEGGTR